MAINFPSTGLTSNVTTYSAGDRTWLWTGAYWKAISTTVGYTGSASTVIGFTGSIGYTGSWGYFGSVGYTGSWGYYGSTGYTGSWGYYGSVGYTGSVGRSSFTYSDDPPSSPVVGDWWMDTTIGVNLMWTYDGTSYQWVEMAASGFLGQAGYTGSIGTTIPVNIQASTYTLALTDNGSYISAAGNITIPSGIFSVGQNISIYNTSQSASISILSASSPATVTAYLAGTTSTGTRTLATNGFATVLCIASNTFLIAGAGLT